MLSLGKATMSSESTNLCVHNIVCQFGVFCVCVCVHMYVHMYTCVAYMCCHYLHHCIHPFPPSRDRCKNGRLLDGKMTYKDFIWFLLSEEDKTSSRRYDGVLKSQSLDNSSQIPLI